ncbi:putative 1,3-beta-glucanosyltransferase [Martiniozyma asiatica (nom. inval.)]|nr:putative 1,3-beta-glucanosyltransferase [Martiniozyma asiatica]
MKISFLNSLIPLLACSNAMLPLDTYSNKFVQPALSGDGKAFYINGVDYQPGGSSSYTSSGSSDVLTDGESCARDATVLQNLGANTIRVYTVNPDLNHDECMSIFNAAGIYVILDVNSPLAGESLNRDDPGSSYYTSYVERIFKVIENFRGYSNVAGFFIGNEVINDDTSAGKNPKYLRALTRDAKEYIKAREKSGGRYIPVGYSAADVVDLREATFEYMTCAINGTNSDISRIDFFGLNSYEWCSGSSDWQTSNYAETKTNFENATVPVFFSEYGCIKNLPRTFDEVDDGIYAGLKDVLSGGLVYEYSEESSGYGLVEINDDDSISLKQDYYNLQKEFKSAQIPSISKSDISDYSVRTCNKTKIESYNSAFDADFNIPDAPDGVADLIKNGVNVTHSGKFVDVSDLTDLYANGADNSNQSEYDSMVNSASSDASLYLTVPSSNLINAISTVASALTTSTATSSSSSQISVSSISSSSKGNADLVKTSWGIGFLGILAALI